MDDRSLIEFADRFPDYTVAVVGDIMLDRYIWGQATRISQEAPVPVVQVDHTSEVPGGAANVAANIAELGGHAVIFGVAGADSDGERLTSLLAQRKIGVDGVVALDTRRTTVKTRIIGNRQQIVRVDSEDTAAMREADRRAVGERLLAGLEDGLFQGIVFEDYAKGLLTPEMVQEIVDAANRRSVFTILDPHPSHPFNVSGLRALTPNRAEAFGLVGQYFQEGVLPLSEDTALREVGRRILRLWRVDLLLVTLGAHGMALFSPNREVVHIPTRAREVFDVSGAGDTVTASFALASLAGASPWQAANLANHAAGIVVGKIGTAPVAADELRQNLTADGELGEEL